MNEYIDRRLSGPDLESELLKLIGKYNSFIKSQIEMQTKREVITD